MPIEKVWFSLMIFGNELRLGRPWFPQHTAWERARKVFGDNFAKCRPKQPWKPGSMRILIWGKQSNWIFIRCRFCFPIFKQFRLSVNFHLRLLRTTSQRCRCFRLRSCLDFRIPLTDTSGPPSRRNKKIIELGIFNFIFERRQTIELNAVSVRNLFIIKIGLVSSFEPFHIFSADKSEPMNGIASRWCRRNSTKTFLEFLMCVALFSAARELTDDKLHPTFFCRLSLLALC